MFSIFFLLFFFQLITTNIVKFKVKEINGRYNVIIPIGTPLVNASFIMDLEIEHNCGSLSLFPEGKSSSLFKVGSGFKSFANGQIINFEIVSERIYLEDSKPYYNFNFYLFNEKEKNILAFSPLIKEERYSLVYSLLLDKKIDQAKFGIIKKNFLERELIIGGFPEEITQKKKSLQCKIIPGRSWSCRLKKIYFGNKVFDNVDKSSFQTNVHSIIAPKNFYEYMIKEYFEEKIKDNLCSLSSEFIECYCSKIKNFPGISFLFENILFELDETDLFISFEKKCRFIVEKNEKDNKWIFGISFIQKYDIEFDYNSGNITFFTDNEVSFVNGIYKEKKNKNFVISIIIVLEYSLFLFMIYSIYIKLRIKNKNLNI